MGATQGQGLRVGRVRGFYIWSTQYAVPNNPEVNKPVVQGKIATGSVGITMRGAVDQSTHQWIEKLRQMFHQDDAKQDSTWPVSLLAQDPAVLRARLDYGNEGMSCLAGGCPL